MSTQYNVSISFAGSPNTAAFGLAVMVTNATTGTPVTGLGFNDFIIYVATRKHGTGGPKVTNAGLPILKP
jgi:hypothetical protein